MYYQYQEPEVIKNWLASSNIEESGSIFNTQVFLVCGAFALVYSPLLWSPPFPPPSQSDPELNINLEKKSNYNFMIQTRHLTSISFV